MKQASLILTLFVTVQSAMAQNIQKINQCLIRDGVLTQIQIDYDRSTGEKTIILDGKMATLTELEESKDYAVNTLWYKQHEDIKFEGRQYQKFGLPRVLGITEVTRAGMYKGVGIYLEAGIDGPYEVIYIPVRPGCEFQPYSRKVIPCGKVTITPAVKSLKRDKQVTFTASVAGTKEKLNYTWVAYSGEIVGDANKKSVTISLKKAESELDLIVEVSGKECESEGSVLIEVTD